jgi:hypothetical protein
VPRIIFDAISMPSVFLVVFGTVSLGKLEGGNLEVVKVIVRCESLVGPLAEDRVCKLCINRLDTP